MSLRPPYSATGRGGTPAPVWEKAFIVMHFARNLAVLANYRTQPRQIPASNYAPVARRCNRRGVCVARPKGKNEKLPGGACSYPGNLSFSLPRGWGGSAAFQFYQLDFYVTTQPSLVLSWAPRKYRPPSFLLSIPQKNEPPSSCDDGGVLLAIILGFRRAARPRDILPRGCPRRNRRPCLPGLRGCSG